MRDAALYGSLDLQQAFLLEICGHLVVRSNYVYDVQLGQASFLFTWYEIRRFQEQTEK